MVILFDKIRLNVCVCIIIQYFENRDNGEINMPTVHSIQFRKFQQNKII